MLTAYLVHSDVSPISDIRFDTFRPNTTATETAAAATATSKQAARAAAAAHAKSSSYDFPDTNPNSNANVNARVNPNPKVLPPGGGDSNILNAIHHITLYAQKSNLHSIPTDCPTREKRGWMGDAQVSSTGALLTLDMAAFYTKFIRDIFDEQELQPDGQKCFAGIVPREFPGTGVGCGAPPWAIAGIVLPYNMWRYGGDERVINRHYDGMKEYLPYLDSVADNTTGLVLKDGLADWCPPSTNKFNVPHQAAAYSQLLGWQMLAAMADAVGRSRDAAAIQAKYARLARSYTAVFWNETTAAFHDDVQTANAMPLALSMGPDAAGERAGVGDDGAILTPTQAARVVDSIAADVAARDGHLSTGIIVVAGSCPMH
jgi:alpha-L-rhamnosidase